MFGAQGFKRWVARDLWYLLEVHLGLEMQCMVKLIGAVNLL